ncbi:MAG: hypothetical protein BIFFINMI_02892 [Phycisphaerae bacterium]|nr:hypothetical protein [Phycisphaerae bacterium]
MRRTRCTAVAMVVGLLLTLVPGLEPAGGAEPAFASKPVVSKSGGKTRISFAVTAPTDVEVAVLDSAGRVVRHLAAGMLGGRDAPPPPLVPGLRQEIDWDLRTDAGKPAQGGPFRIQVRLGLGVKFDGFIGENRFHIGAPYGVATDDAGNVYLCTASTGNKGPDGAAYLLKFDRSGKYIRTLMPMPADLAADRVKGFDPIPAPGGYIVPRNVRDTWPVFYPGGQPGALAARVSADGTICFFSWDALSRLAPDGGCVGDAFGRSIWPPNGKPAYSKWQWQMVKDEYAALSPDGKFVYAAGLRDKKPGGDYPADRVYRIAIDGGHIEKFADVAGDAPVRGLAFDRDGHLLACAPDRVAVLDAAGKEIGAIKIANPLHVACHRKTGAVYVLTDKESGWWQAKKSLVAFDGWKDAREVARLDLRDLGYNAVMALDDTGEQPVLWVVIERTKGASPYNPGHHSQLLRVEQQGDKFTAGDPGIRCQGDPMGVVTRLAVHPDTETVVCRGEYSEAAGYEGLTGRPVKLPFRHAPDMAAGLDGNWYVMTGNNWQGPLCRYDRDFKPLEVSADLSKARGAVNAVGWAYGRYGSGFGVGGIAADADGRVYSLQMVNHRTNSSDCVVVFGPDGQCELGSRMKGNPLLAEQKPARFDGAIFGPIEITNVGNIAVDWQGNMYVALRCYPVGFKGPPGFEKDAGYWQSTGSVIKVLPQGGSYFFIDGPEARPPRKTKPPAGMKGLVMTRLGGGWPTGPGFCENGVVAYPDLGAMSGGFPGCHCRQPMFALDGWGRVWVPNAFTYAVKVYDNAGTELFNFGHYGNADSRGPGADSPIKTPAVPLGWPEAVAVSDRAAYVADVLNRRIVRLLKTFAAEEVCQAE